MSQKQTVRPQNESRSKQVSCDASTEQKSIKFLKQMIALQTSHIVFLRGIPKEGRGVTHFRWALPTIVLHTSYRDFSFRSEFYSFLAFLSISPGIFDEKEFKDRFIDDLKIKMLRDNESDENIHRIIEWMRGGISFVPSLDYTLIH